VDYPPGKERVAIIPFGPLILQEIPARLLFAVQLCKVFTIGTLNSGGKTIETISPLINFVEGVILNR
jgi:hypothetical protein